MKNTIFNIFIILLFSTCQESQDSIVGAYELLVSGVKNVSKGELQIAGEPDDHFGNMTFFSKKGRIYKIGLTSHNNDSLSFILAESGGFLKLKKEIDSRVGIQGST